jgi:hypothetical protein
MAISPKLPTFRCQDCLEEVVRCKFRRAGLDSRAVSLQFRIGLSKADRNVPQTVSVICLQFGKHALPHSSEF